MDDADRQKHLMRVTRMLVILTGTGLGLIALSLYVLIGLSEQTPSRTYLLLYVFAAGLMGGFVSLQQRLPDLNLQQLCELSHSWFTVLLVPINGGIFAIVLHLMFMAGLLTGAMFPDMGTARAFDTEDPVGSFYVWLTYTLPVSGQDVAKLLFWSFVAGFSERFVPQIIRRATNEVEPTSEQDDKDKDAAAVVLAGDDIDAARRSTQPPASPDSPGSRTETTGPSKGDPRLSAYMEDEAIVLDETSMDGERVWIGNFDVVLGARS